MAERRPSFAIGSRVEWSSTSNGVTTTKSGKVVQVVNRGEYPMLIWKETGIAHYGPFDKTTGDPLSFVRTHESYVVEVLHKGSRGKAVKPHYYWPLVSKLREVK